MRNLTFIFVLISSSLFSQTVNKLLFDSLKIFHYKAVFIDKNGDTLSNEKILLTPLTKDGVLKFTYFTTDTTFSKFQNVRNRKGENQRIKRVNETWTTFTESNSEIWMHPFRENQYAYTEVAPFPIIRVQKLKVGEDWKGGAYIFSGWGNLKGRMRNYYQVLGSEEYNFMGQLLANCWRINGIGRHNRLGVSTINYLYHKDYGFLQMSYDSFDGNKILFILEKIENK